MQVEEEAQGVVTKTMAATRNSRLNLARALVRLFGREVAKAADHHAAFVHHTACGREHLEKAQREFGVLGRRR